jgi:CIC family chloride channel protein
MRKSFAKHGAVARLRLRQSARDRETTLVLLSLVLGLCAGLVTLAQSGIAHLLQSLFYGIPPGDRLSAQTMIDPARLLALPLGGILLVGFNHFAARKGERPIDVIEANALHGGVIPMRGSLVVSGQTLVSNGCGASIGLEAAFAQMGGGISSVAGQWLRMRRADLRLLVGAGAGSAVGAAFGAPLTGIFYAFEIVLGAYTPAAIAPVAAAATAAALVMLLSGEPAYMIAVPATDAITTAHYFLFAALGLVCAIAGIALMLAVTSVEQSVRRLPIDQRWAPVIGGLLLIPIALVTPQALSAGHGALHLNLTTQIGVGALILVLLCKSAASAISLGFGFRGGLFFASLFLGSLVGQLFAAAVSAIPGLSPLSSTDAALVGMAALAVTVVGGPLTMSFLVLEATHDFALAAVTLTASLCAGTFVRQTFGFSFATWRLHMRGETIRSARDIGRFRTLTAERVMRKGPPVFDASLSIAEFHRRYPLLSAEQVIAVDGGGHYAGLIDTAAAHAPDIDADAPLRDILQLTDIVLSPDQDVATMVRMFDVHEAKAFAVTDWQGRVVGLVSERCIRRRYAEEMVKAERDMFGERQ